MYNKCYLLSLLVVYVLLQPISEMVLQACRNKTPPNVDLVRNYLEQNSYDVNIREDDEVTQ